MSAEMFLAQSSLVELGLASMGPRSDERGNAPILRISKSPWPLQWGRARMSAEMRKKGPWPDCSISASMGPRSDERGNVEFCGGRWRSCKLQWGRARMSAEIRLARANCWPCYRLQWGRARMSAEIERASVANGRA